jgi:hypothetical protein
MIAAFRYEIIRLATLRTSRRVPSLALGAALCLGIASALAVSADAAPRTVALIRLLAALPVLAASVVLGVQSSGEERHHRLRAVTLAVVPHRTRLAVAKAATVAVGGAVMGALGSLAASAGYSLAIAWAYAGDRTLIPDDAVAAPMARGLMPAAAAAAAAGLLGVAVGWLTLWYRTAIGVAVAAVVLAAPVAAGRLAHRSDVAAVLGRIESAVRALPGVGGVLNPRILSVWPGARATGVNPMPPTSLATTALIAALAMVLLVAGAVKWQRD